MEEEEKSKRDNYFKKMKEQEKFEEELKLKREKANEEKKQKAHEKNLVIQERQEQCKKKIEQDLEKLKIKIDEKEKNTEKMIVDILLFFFLFPFTCLNNFC